MTETDELVGWKEITSYLSVCRVTAWKWHKRYGLPIIILPSGRTLASKAEIDAWKAKCSVKLQNMINQNKQ